MWLLGQFLGWAEILRREVQYLDLGTAERSEQLQGHLKRIASILATDSNADPAFRVFRADQRATGEV